MYICKVTHSSLSLLYHRSLYPRLPLGHGTHGITFEVTLARAEDQGVTTEVASLDCIDGLTAVPPESFKQ